MDDEEDIRDVLTITLTDAGYEVTSAPDGKAALRLVEEFDPHIVITDMRMPVMDGLTLLREIKRQYSDPEVVIATAYGDVETAIQALQLDASDFVTKPISDTALSLALGRAKERYSSRKQLSDYTYLLEQENAETTQELMRTIAYQRRLIDSSMDGILGCDADEKVVIFNRALEEMLGLSRFQVLGQKKLADFFTPARLDKLKAGLENERYGGRGRLFLHETRIDSPQGSSIPVQVSGSRITELEENEGLGLLFSRPAGTAAPGTGNGRPGPGAAPGQDDVPGPPGGQRGP